MNIASWIKNGRKRPLIKHLLCHVLLFATPWTVSCKAFLGISQARNPWDFPGKKTGVLCHFLLQEIFLIQGLRLCLLCLLHWQEDSLPLSHLGHLIQTHIFSLFTVSNGDFKTQGKLLREFRPHQKLCTRNHYLKISSSFIYLQKISKVKCHLLIIQITGASLVAHLVKNLSAVQETQV